MAPGMKEPITRKIYNIQSHFYDELLGNMIRRRQGSALSRMNIRSGDKVLDIGIGTGVSLEMYPRHCQIVGIDISEGMLSKAVQRVRETGRDNASLVIADAMNMPFPDSTFDHILISHVITVVSDPIRLLEHIKRVGKPNCRIVIINHFQSGYRPMAWLEKVLSPVCVHLGWRSDLNLHELLQQADLEVDFRYKVRNLDLWEIVFMRNNKPRLGCLETAMRRTPPLPMAISDVLAPAPVPARI
ncbi:MAG: methyltransferase domain-containing protein [Phycisphaerae bacterium]|nr:methyltransferase domain-containing protein [Phycisphaerae bacterium]